MTPMMIVAATDFSAAAGAAVERAALIARERQAQLTLAYAFDETRWENLRSLARPKKKLFADQPVEHAWTRIRESADQVSRKRGIVVAGVVAMGQAAEAIAATAAAVHASLIALGPHGRRMGDRLYFGIHRSLLLASVILGQNTCAEAAIL